MASPRRHHQLASGVAIATALLSIFLIAATLHCDSCDAFTTVSSMIPLPSASTLTHPIQVPPPLPSYRSSTGTALFAKKKGSTPRANPNYSNKKSGGQQPQQEKASVKEARFDAATRQFMFTLVGLTKTLPDKSKDILKNINLSFYPGAKIGVVGLNGSGKVRCLIMIVFVFLVVSYENSSTRTRTLVLLPSTTVRSFLSPHSLK